MQNPGAVASEGDSLLATDRGEQFRVRDQIRVGAQDAGDLFPELDFLRVERGSDPNGGQVRAVRAQRRDVPRLVEGNEPGDHGNRRTADQSTMNPRGRALRRRKGTGFTNDEAGVVGVDRDGRVPLTGELGRDDARAHSLSEREHEVPQASVRFPLTCVRAREPREHRAQIEQVPIEQISR